MNRFTVLCEDSCSKDKEYDFDVSIIIIMYNPDLSKLFCTLDSILLQKNLRYEVIICDDGSKNPIEQEIQSYFILKKFISYSLIFHVSNQGTVSNLYSGLKRAKGKYCKVISPGDYLTDSNSLFEWVEYLEIKEVDWSFSDTYYYKTINNKKCFLESKAQPQNIRCYARNMREQCIWNYVVLRDNANGASIIGNTKIQLFFCGLIKEKGVRYSEDLIWFLIMFYGNVGSYFPKPVVCYEYGSGISTSKSDVWNDRLIDDLNVVYQIIVDENRTTKFQKKIQKAIYRKRVLRGLLIRGKLYHWLKFHLFPRLTKIPDIRQMGKYII